MLIFEKYLKLLSITILQDNAFYCLPIKMNGINTTFYTEYAE